MSNTNFNYLDLLDRFEDEIKDTEDGRLYLAEANRVIDKMVEYIENGFEEGDIIVKPYTAEIYAMIFHSILQYLSDSVELIYNVKYADGEKPVSVTISNIDKGEKLDVNELLRVLHLAQKLFKKFDIPMLFTFINSEQIVYVTNNVNNTEKAKRTVLADSIIDNNGDMQIEYQEVEEV